jgi:RNA polymerase sigma-70 factor, ECF subfamily
MSTSAALPALHSRHANASPSLVPETIHTLDYSKLRKDLARAVARICPRWLLGQREDLVQAAVMRVMQVVAARADEGEGITAVSSSYLYKAAHSALVDEIRRVRRRRETDLEEEVTEPVAIETTNPERAAASREIGEGVEDCLTRLVADRRLAVTLYLQGHSVPESARVLDWPAKRTENLVYRGLADLRDCLRSKGLRP